jgi:hypothetical protein
MPDAWSPPTLGDAAAADPTIVACCNAIIQHVNQKPADYTRAQIEISQCCPLLANPFGAACTPWGPPVPPAMPALRRVHPANAKRAA